VLTLLERDAPYSQLAEKVVYGVIPSEARNPSLFKTQEKRDSSANSVPRNDNILIVPQSVRTRDAFLEGT